MSYIVYTKTECSDCDLILSVQWQQKYVGMFSPRTYAYKTSCPFCKTTNVNTYKINEIEFNQINEMWDLTDSAKEDDNEINVWCKTCE